MGDVFELGFVWLVSLLVFVFVPRGWCWLGFVPLALWSVAFVVQARFKGGVGR